MARKRAGERDIEIPKVKEPNRRAECGESLELFEQIYFPDLFYLSSSSIHKEINQNLEDLILHGGRRAIAAPRGCGKTTKAKVAICWMVCYGYRRFGVLFTPSMRESQSRMEDIKFFFEFNSILCEDFPEICVPVRALEGSAQRGRKQTVEGKPTFLKWGADQIVFPMIEGSPSSGIMIVPKGLDSPIRGLVRGSDRPDFAMGDDIENQESVYSEVETNKIDRTLSQDVEGLAGPGRTLASLLLCTIMKTDCLADVYTDPSRKPAWRGKRYKALVKKPDNEGAWEKYMDLRKAQQERDGNHDEANKLYEENRKSMDAGAVVAWEENYDKTQGEISALQAIYNKICTMGWEHFAVEYQNEPPELEGTELSTISSGLVRSRTNGIPGGVVPADATKIVAAIDVHARYLYWVVVAGRPGGSMYCLAHEYVEVFAPDKVNAKDPNDPNRIALERAVLNALNDTWERIKQPWEDTDGNKRDVALCMVDAGWKDSIVYEFCKQDVIHLKPTVGRGHGKQQVRFTMPAKRTKTRRLGTHWFQEYQQKGRQWLTYADANFWKQYIHDRFMTAPGQSGAMTLYGDDAREHITYSRHVVSERTVEELHPKHGLISVWKHDRGANHFLDATYNTAVALSMLGCSVLPSQPILVGRPQRASGKSWADKIREMRGQK